MFQCHLAWLDIKNRNQKDIGYDEIKQCAHTILTILGLILTRNAGS